MRESSIADSADIKFECSQCGQRMVVEKSAAGLTADCPMCQTPVIVPHFADETAEPVVESRVAARSKIETHREPAHRLEAELAEAREELTRHRSLLKKAVEECERLNANATHVQAESKTFQTDRQQLKADLALARQAVGTADSRASELADSLSAAQAELEAFRFQAEGETRTLQEKLLSATAQLALREEELLGSQAEQTDTLRQLGRTRAELGRLQTESAGLRSEIEIVRQDFEMTTQELAATSQQFSEMSGRLQQLEAEHPQVLAERDQWQQKAVSLQADLVKLDAGRELLELRAQHATVQETLRKLETTLAERTASAHQENEILRGIVARQNADLAKHHSAVRRLRRGRYALRLVYAIFSLLLVGLGFLAFSVLAPQEFQKLSGHLQFLRP